MSRVFNIACPYESNEITSQTGVTVYVACFFFLHIYRYT